MGGVFAPHCTRMEHKRCTKLHNDLTIGIISSLVSDQNLFIYVYPVYPFPSEWNAWVGPNTIRRFGVAGNTLGPKGAPIF